MKKFNVIKRWKVNNVDYCVYISSLKGVSFEQGFEMLESAHDEESATICQDTDREIDFDSKAYPFFKVLRNGVEFTYSIEEDYIFEKMAENFRPKRIYPTYTMN